MTSKAYVVVSIDYDYDDNYYHSKGDAGNPVHVFLDKDLADKVCAEKNLKELTGLIRSEELTYYLENGISEEEVSAYKEAGFTVKKVQEGRWADYHIESAPDNITPEQAQKLFDGISLQWFRVAEVDATVNPLYKQYLSKT